MMTTFLSFWSQFGNSPLSERRKYFNSLSKQQQKHLLHSFYSGGWDKFFVKIHIDEMLDLINLKYGIDLIDLRIKVIKFNRVFLIERSTWEYIEHILLEYKEYYNTDIIFGGIEVSQWGRHGQFCRVGPKTGGLHG